MGAVGKLLGLPVAGPIGALQWLAQQVANAAWEQMMDPGRIQTALLALEQKLEAGLIDEAAFEAEEDKLLEELNEIRAARAAETSPAVDEP
jgi:hypothetical protein